MKTGQRGVSAVSRQIFLWLTILFSYNLAIASSNHINFNFLQASTLNWTKQVGTSGGGITVANGVSADINGNVYVGGQTNVGSYGQIQNGYNYFIAKYDKLGNLIWTNGYYMCGSCSGAYVSIQGVSSDNNGDVYAVGYTNTSVNGQIGQGGIYEYFIVKYDQYGNLIWTKQVGAYGCETYAQGVSTDANNNIYVIGYTNGGISGQTKTGTFDYFIAKYDVNGNLQWSRQIGAAYGYTYGYGVIPDNHGNFYITGYTNTGISNQKQNGVYDYFIAKWVDGSSPTLLWTKQVGTYGGTVKADSISTNGNGNIYITGYTNKGISGQKQSGVIDYFIAQYDVSGNLIWTKEIGDPDGYYNLTYATGVSEDNNSNIYVSGYTNAGISGQIQSGVYDYFIAKYDVTGNLIWTSQVGASEGITQANSISSDNNGNVYTVGTTTKGISSQAQNGNYDYFIAQYVN